MNEKNETAKVKEDKITVAQFIEKLKQLDQDKIISYDYGLPIDIFELDDGYTIG